MLTQKQTSPKMNIAKDIVASIGSTPLVRLNKLNKGGAQILLKLEFFNPSGSIKDRAALAMIEGAEKRGLLKKGGTVIEPTSGNTGIGLAMVCAVKGYKAILTMPDTMSPERRAILKSFGAELVLTDGSKGMSGAIEKALELKRKNKNAFIPQQFENPDNPKIHEKTTALEIWKDTNGKVDAVVAGVGTGGTITGVARKLKKLNPKIKIYAVEPAESPVLSGGKAGPHKIQGIGAGFIPKNYDPTLIDEVIAVSSDNAIKTAKALAKKEGVHAGISSGAAVFAALQLSKRKENKNKKIITITPDTGSRYLGGS